MSNNEMKHKYIVIKKEDVKNAFDFNTEEGNYLHSGLTRALCSINNYRRELGKEFNNYIVINTDEPYVSEIIEILKANGHWG